MFVLIQKNAFAKFAILLCPFCLFLMLISLQDSVAQSAGEDADVEEIVVTGQRSLRLLRLEMEGAENEIYDIFNETYADTDYEITCVRERPIKEAFNPINTTSWAVRTCRSKLAHSLYKQEQRDYAEYVHAGLNDEGDGMNEVGATVDTEYFVESNVEHNEDLLQKVSDLVMENREYREKIEKYANLKIGYEAAVEADFAKGNFFTNLFRSRD
jgi:hypothetical protein